MRKLFIILVALSFIAVSGFVFAEEEVEAKKKGASDTAYEHASDNSVFNRVSDWFATVGKSEEEKEKILQERRMQRATKRTEKEEKRAEKQAEKTRRKMKKELEEVEGKAEKVVEE